MRIINTFADFHPLENYYPVCKHCGHEGFPFDARPHQSVLNVLRRFKCNKCHTKRVTLAIIFSYGRLRMRSRAWFSDDLRGPIEVPDIKPAPFEGCVS